MEHAQRAFLMRYAGEPVLRLNPYFNGTCSKSYLFVLFMLTFTLS